MSGLASAVPGEGTGDVPTVHQEVTTKPQPHPSPKEMIIHTGSNNHIDPMMYQQKFFLSQFAWNTTHRIGHILFRTPVTPTTGFAQLKYLSKMYNAWTGGLEFDVSIAGTGFNGGRLIACVLPPNYLDNDNIDIPLVNTFANEMIDVKSQNESVLVTGDQRNVEYHWMNKFPSSDKFASYTNAGGVFVIMVQMPLISGNASTQSVNVLVRQSLAPDFRFSQMIVPNIDTTPAVEFPNLDLFTSTFDSDMMFGVKYRSVVAYPSIAQMHNPGSMVPIGNFKDSPAYYNRTVLAQGRVRDERTVDLNTVLYKPPRIRIEAVKSNLFGYGLSSDNNNCEIFNYFGAGIGFDQDGKVALSIGSNQGINQKDAVWAAIEPEVLWQMTIVSNSDAFITAPNGEQVLGFTDRLPNIPYASHPWPFFLTPGMYQVLSTADASLEPGMDHVFQMVDKSTGIPLCLVRLNSEGFLSCNMPVRTVIDYDKVQFRYFTAMSHNSTLPSESSSSLNPGMIALIKG